MATGESDRDTDLPALPSELPVVPLRNAVVLPLTAAPLAVSRQMSVEAVNRALSGDRLVLLLLQKNDVDEPSPDDLHRVGTAAIVRQMTKGPNGLRILVEGVARVRVEFISQSDDLTRALIKPLPEPMERTIETDAHVRRMQELVDRALSLATGLSPDVRTLVASLDDPLRVAYLVASLLDMKAEDKQRLLEEDSASVKLNAVNMALAREIEILELKGKIESQAQQEMTDAQRQYMLRQQLKAIQAQLGEGDTEIESLRERSATLNLPEKITETLDREITRLEKMTSASPEYQMLRTYLDWVMELPWSTATEDRLDPVEARRVLDEDHYDLDKVKERIVEYLAVRKLKGDMKGPILCFVGPPGVGKTSLGQSIARAMNRKFVRISLGGVRDEAEIRGHRRTYIGSMPGRIVQALKQAGSINPVFMLDEVDKMAAGFHGDPAAALLEVLDPAQNHSFRDHYLEIPLDLSRVLFIATANSLGSLHPALLDRMELIYLGGYTEEDKLHIARIYLIPRQESEHGLAKGYLRLSETALRRVITEYTREAGVRNLERQIGTIARKVAARVAVATVKDESTEPKEIDVDDLREYLGLPRFRPDGSFRLSRPGVVTGLAWTESGGDVLFIEALVLPGGKGTLTLTGQLGNVMQESARAAVSHIRQQAQALGIDPAFMNHYDLHVHVPAGAIPKDGPSAGITMATAIVSALRNQKVRADVAMTGEITLSGLVLPIGGVREKSLAARRMGVTTVILPEQNMMDVEDLPAEVRKGMTFMPVKTLEEVLAIALPNVIDKAVADVSVPPPPGNEPAPAS
ncbi:MAG: endopeptidase La [Acidobacteriota bacterium]|nr:endopeptidase La [Acidobacteriota bacterium]